MQGLLGKKIGMTRVFDDAGRQVPVTVMEVGPCVIVQQKTQETDGYTAYQIGFQQVEEQKVTKPLRGRFKKVGIKPVRYLQEFPMEEGDNFAIGDIITVSMFEKIGWVDVIGTTKGRGFQGVMRRHGMSGGPMTHGGHSKRRVGSIGCRELPGRIHKNKRMPGHMGNQTITQQNLRVVQVRKTENQLLVRGSIPGANGSLLIIKRALKRAINE